jgi:N6-L-threonylcarbamoyladenine synthase
MIVLGIDSSCDETAAALVRDGRHCLASVVASQVALHERFGGVVPEIACRAHVENLPWAVDQALQQAQLSLDDVDGIAVTHRPGLVSALLVGVSAAKGLALARGLPLVGVDHIAAHVHANFLAEGPPPEFPCVALVVSGGHTSLYHCPSPHEHVLIGATRDDAAGEAFDKVAQMLSLPYPGGPSIDKAAEQGDPKAIRFPRTGPGKETLDFSFSGLKTSVLYKAFGQDLRPQDTRGVAPRFPVADVAASFQEAVVDVLVKTTFRALGQTGVRSLLVGGGVAANSRLRARLLAEGRRRGVDVRIPAKPLCTDNAAMVAVSGTFRLQAGERDGLDLDCHPRPIRAERG